VSRFILSVDTFSPPTVGNLPFQYRDQALFAFEAYQPRFEKGELWRLVLLERSGSDGYKVVHRLINYNRIEPRERFEETPVADQVRILRQDPDFRDFLRSYRPPLCMGAASIILWLCSVDSLTDIEANDEARERWLNLVHNYQCWQMGA
jgi:hypothetical protein